MDIPPVVVLEAADKATMAERLGAVLTGAGPLRPDLPSWDWDDAQFMLRRLRSPGRGEYDARACGLLSRLGLLHGTSTQAPNE